jgi:hypothetical protein
VTPRATRRRLPRAGLAVIAVAAVAAFAAGLTFADGEYESIDRPTFVDADREPAWARPCRRERPRAYVLPCARVSGRVLYVEHVDPDGDGDRHVLAAASGHLVIVKFPAATPADDIPGLGGTVRASGQLSPGRLGLPEVTAELLGAE